MGSTFSALCPLVEFYDSEDFDSIYEVDDGNCIGTGKFAVVHMCNRKNQPEKKYALKVINTRVGDMASLNRIHEEISILQTLGNHPGLVSLIDVDESLPGAIRLVLELCEGGELYDRIQQKQYYPEQEAKAAVRCLLEAVAYIHSHGIMHRDLKPENILLASRVSNTELKISDFGLAKMSKDYPRRLPRSHSICGSDFYLAPEVIKQEEYGREIDIWALGVITYVLLSGSLPFFHNVLHKLYRQIVERDLSFPDQAWKNVSKGALDFILRLLQVRPGDRLTADQALSHPWLRNGSSAASFNSFTTANSQGMAPTANYYNTYAGGYGGMPRPVLHPLEHARKAFLSPMPYQFNNPQLGNDEPGVKASSRWTSRPPGM
ncbi:mlkA [Symbiodinium microadriaticum]|nr:mlkA [Symbiodinium microadriaticum]CAE7650795.1 mlkA [Symbiodinium sp. KB8]